MLCNKETSAKLLLQHGTLFHCIHSFDGMNYTAGNCPQIVPMCTHPT